MDAYLKTVERLEPDIAAIDTPAALASIAISLKRIADALGGDGEHCSLLELIADRMGPCA